MWERPVTMTNPELRGADRVREVFARVRNGDASVADLYADDGVVLFGATGRAEGRAAIRTFYANTISSIAPKPQVQGVLEAPPYFIAIVDVPTTDGFRRALDLFEIDEKGI